MANNGRIGQIKLPNNSIYDINAKFINGYTINSNTDGDATSGFKITGDTGSKTLTVNSNVTIGSPTQWGVIYGGASNTYSSTAAGTSGQFLKANGAAAPSWATLSSSDLSDKANLAKISGASAFTSGQDLDALVAVGTYGGDNASTANLVHTPNDSESSSGCILYVSNSLGTSGVSYRRQDFRFYRDNHRYTRHTITADSNNGWTAWQADVLMPVSNGLSAVGDVNTPVYVNSSGVVTAITGINSLLPLTSDLILDGDATSSHALIFKRRSGSTDDTYIDVSIYNNGGDLYIDKLLASSDPMYIFTTPRNANSNIGSVAPASGITADLGTFSAKWRKLYSTSVKVMYGSSANTDNTGIDFLGSGSTENIIAHIGCGSEGGIGLYGGAPLYFRPGTGSGTRSTAYGMILTTTALYPEDTATTLGTSSARWANLYATNVNTNGDIEILANVNDSKASNGVTWYTTSGSNTLYHSRVSSSTTGALAIAAKRIIVFSVADAAATSAASGAAEYAAACLNLKNNLLYPATTNVMDLGSSDYRWANIYTTNIYGSLAGIDLLRLATGSNANDDTKGLNFTHSGNLRAHIGANNSGGLGIYSSGALYLRPNNVVGTLSATEGAVLDTTALYPGNATTPADLGKSAAPWGDTYTTNLILKRGGTRATAGKGYLYLFGEEFPNWVLYDGYSGQSGTGPGSTTPPPIGKVSGWATRFMAPIGTDEDVGWILESTDETQGGNVVARFGVHSGSGNVYITNNINMVDKDIIAFMFE